MTLSDKIIMIGVFAIFAYFMIKAFFALYYIRKARKDLEKLIDFKFNLLKKKFYVESRFGFYVFQMMSENSITLADIMNIDGIDKSFVSWRDELLKELKQSINKESEEHLKTFRSIFKLSFPELFASYIFKGYLPEEGFDYEKYKKVLEEMDTLKKQDKEVKVKLKEITKLVDEIEQTIISA